MVIVGSLSSEKKRKTDDACLFIFPFWWWIEVLVVFEKKTNKIKIDRKTMIKETLMASKQYVRKVKFARKRAVCKLSVFVDLYIIHLEIW